MKRVRRIIPVVVLILTVAAAALILSACGNKSMRAAACNHDYYLSDYSAPTATKNGYNVYTCKICGNSYKEIIPSTGIEASIANDSNTTPEDNGFSKNSRTVKLFDLPIYSDDNNNAVNTLNYPYDVQDYDGYHHNDCYMVATANEQYRSRYIRYDLEGKYSTLSGKIYSHTGEPGSAWLEFYDGDDFLYSTAKLSKDNTSTEFEIDISGVKYLTVYPVNDGSANSASWFVTDRITVAK